MDGRRRVNVVCVTPQYPPLSLVGSWLATHQFLAHLARDNQVVVYRRLVSAFPYTHDGISVRPGKKDEIVVDAIADADVVVSHLGDDGFACQEAQKAGRPDVRMVHSYRTDIAERLEGCSLAVFNSENLRTQANWDGEQMVCHPPLRPFDASPGRRVTLINMSQAKGGELFERLARKLPDINFLGVKGGYDVQLPNFVPKNYRKPNVQIIRTTPHMDQVYAQTRVLLMPSSHESWGMTGVEAMSCGIPVIAHPTPGLQESLGSAGIFADRDVEADWLAQIERLTDDTEWNAASAAAKARAGELSQDDALERFTSTLETLALCSGGLAA